MYKVYRKCKWILCLCLDLIPRYLIINMQEFKNKKNSQIQNTVLLVPSILGKGYPICITNKRITKRYITLQDGLEMHYFSFFFPNHYFHLSSLHMSPRQLNAPYFKWKKEEKGQSIQIFVQVSAVGFAWERFVRYYLWHVFLQVLVGMDLPMWHQLTNCSCEATAIATQAYFCFRFYLA